jgi:hypothetical protein
MLGPPNDTSHPADDDAASKKTATLDDVTSPDIGVVGEHIDTDERAAPMRELPEKLVESIKGLKIEKTAGVSKSDEKAFLITKSALKNREVEAGVTSRPKMWLRPAKMLRHYTT